MTTNIEKEIAQLTFRLGKEYLKRTKTGVEDSVSRLLYQARQIISQQQVAIDAMQPAINWRKYPDEKPENASKVFCVIKPSDDFRICEAFYNKGYFGARSGNFVLYWCYESDLLATLPTPNKENV